MNFIKSAAAPADPPEKAWFFIFSNHHILVSQENEDQASIPLMDYDKAVKLGLQEFCYIGEYKRMACYSALVAKEFSDETFLFVNIRAFLRKVDIELFRVIGFARQIHDWNINFKFCGRCGAMTQQSAREYSKKCPECDLVSYPRISPAILAAVVKQDRILLARGINFPDKKMFSVLAGFVDPGETLEACVEREVFEETGIRVKEIHYFGSQPWPFPDSLMIAFTAKYDSGDIIVDPGEIAEAGWFSADQLPVVPGKPTLSGELIEWFVSSQNR